MTVDHRPPDAVFVAPQSAEARGSPQFPRQRPLATRQIQGSAEMVLRCSRVHFIRQQWGFAFDPRNFKPTLRKAADRLATLHTPEGMPLPPNVLAELQRAMARLGFVVSQIREIEQARQKRLEQQPETGPHTMVRQLSRVVGVGIETADMLVHEVLSRPMRDRKAVARYAGLTGSPDESGTKRREQGLARAGNARVRRGMIQLAWRFLLFQKDSALALWYRARTADSRSGTRKAMIVALARKLIIALWRFVTIGEPLEGVVLRPAS